MKSRFREKVKRKTELGWEWDRKREKKWERERESVCSVCEWVRE